MKIHRQLTAAAFLFISMAIMAQVPFSKKEVIEKMKQVADWQISNPNTAHEHHDLDWTNGALYVGMVDWAKLAEEEYNDSTYHSLTYTVNIKKRKYWLLPWHVRNGLSTIHPTVHSNWSMVTTKP